MTSKVTVLCDNVGHAVFPRLEAWVNATRLHHGGPVELVSRVDQLTHGRLLFLVSCGQIIPRGVREQYDHCLVLHASQLPEGRGWSPHIWQVLEGRDSLTVSLLEAEDAVDTGDIWQRLTIPLDGTELLDEINEKVFEAELALMEWAILHYHTVVPEPQVGLPTYYRRRTPADNEIDPEQSLLALMPTLRVSDADRYPAFFYYRGQKYRLHLTKVEPSE